MDVLTELVKFLQEVSPLVWQSLIKQVYSEAIGYLAWGIGLALLCLPLFRFAKKRMEDDDLDLEGLLAYLGVGIAAPASLLLLTSAIQRLINPEFYAMRFIIGG